MPIIDKHTFDQVQRILELRAPKGENSRYPYEDTKVVCPFCGEKLVTRIGHLKTNRKMLGCFGENGCQKFAVKTWMVDAVLLAAFEELDGIKGASDGAKRMKEVKKTGTPESVEYFFLDDCVKKIEFEGTVITPTTGADGADAVDGAHGYEWTMKVAWTNGTESELPLPESRTEEPTKVAKDYQRYEDRLNSGEYIPKRPTCLRERIAMETLRTVTVVNT